MNVYPVFGVQAQVLADDLGVAVAFAAVEIDELAQVVFEEAAVETLAFLGLHGRAQGLAFDALFAAVNEAYLGHLVAIGLAGRCFAQLPLGRDSLGEGQTERGGEQAHRNSRLRPMPSP